VQVLRSVYCDGLGNSTIILFNFANCSFTIEFNSSSLIPDFFVSFCYLYFLCHTRIEVLTAALFGTMQRLVQILIPLYFWNVIALDYYPCREISLNKDTSRNKSIYRRIKSFINWILFKHYIIKYNNIIFWRCGPMRDMDSSMMMFPDRIQRRTLFGRTPLFEWSARSRDLYLTTHNIHKRQTDIHDPGGIRTYNPSKQEAADPLLRPRDHWDRQ
jgi:hypothetical protein